VPGRVEGDIVELEPIFVRRGSQLVCVSTVIRRTWIGSTAQELMWRDCLDAQT
jgi:hypothetical protein